MARTQVTADQSVGRLLSWLTGRKSIENADSPTSAAVGTLVSWITGKKKGRWPGRYTGSAIRPGAILCSGSNAYLTARMSASDGTGRVTQPQPVGSVSSAV